MAEPLNTEAEMDSSLEPPATPPLLDNGETPTDSDSGGGGLSRLAMSMIGSGGATTGSAPVPDVLLSLAKDDRYISQVASLLSQVAVPFASIFLLPRGGQSQRSNNNNVRNHSGSGGGEDILEDDGRRFIERIRPELNLLASILVYSATFVFYSRNFGDIVETKNNGDSMKRSLGMESLNLAYRYPVRKNGGSASSSSSTSMKKRSSKKRLDLGDYMKRMLSSLEINQWHRLLFLQTMVPYIMHRVGRGGWSKDLGGFVSNLMDQCGLLGPVTRSDLSRRNLINNGSVNNEQINEDDDDVALLNDDRLRGSSRRRLFEEQRRRMLSSASSSMSQTSESDNLGGNSEGSETLDGDGSNAIRHQPASARDNHNQTITTRSLRNEAFDRRFRKFSTFVWNATSRLSLAVSSLSHGAHSLPGHIGMTSGENLDRYAKILKWFLRLHMALFYWNGVYPTFAHRLAGAKIRDDVAPYAAGLSHSTMAGAIVANRPSYKPIAALILCQAVAALAQTTAEGSIEVAHFIQVSFFRWRRRRRTQQQNQQQNNETSSLEDQTSPSHRINSERAEYMEMIEDRVPGITSSKKDTTNPKHKSRSKKGNRTKHTGSDSHVCGICLNERVNPAAPSVCGHVFCWNCVLHWVSNVRAECPLCRAKTRPQEIIPLYNYP